jgi:hypothetical protein
MEVLRRKRRNMINTEISTASAVIKRSNATVTRIKGSAMGEIYIKSQILKLTELINTKELHIENLNKELSKIALGDVDSIIMDEIENKKLTSVIDQNKRDIAKKAKRVEKAEKAEISMSYYQGIRQAGRSDKRNIKDYRYCLKYHDRVVSELPDFMKKKLARMPNNKGHIWRGIHFYGLLQEEKGPLTMFERKKGGVIMIYETTPTRRNVYEKEDGCRKNLISSTARKPKVSGTNIMDYVKD